MMQDGGKAHIYSTGEVHRKRVEDYMGAGGADMSLHSWPTEHGNGPIPTDFTTTNGNFGTHIRCSNVQPFREHEHRAGRSKRVNAFYQKTGATENRVDGPFLETRGHGRLTESFQRPTPFNNTSSLVLTQKLREKEGVPWQPSSKPPSTAGSRRSRAESMFSERSGRSAVSMRSDRSGSVRTASSRGRTPAGFDFRDLPGYSTTNRAYGRQATPQGDTRRAGVSHSGFQALVEGFY
mmetsp:Transcript_84685/g.226369  ORF Transcript_84685/g.226369 Transcript_84685/m.226369 type:complete len:236 (-) Transcript_84685:31-738(-)